MTDWINWHKNYEDPNSSISRRLLAVRKRIGEALDRSPAGTIRMASMCAGDGRDILGVLDLHPRAKDVTGRLVEWNPQLVERARSSAPSTIEVVCGDAGISDSYDGIVPVDLLLCCGVFGRNDLRNEIRRWASESGFEELAFDGMQADYGVGVSRMTRSTTPYQPGIRFFSFTPQKRSC